MSLTKSEMEAEIERLSRERDDILDELEGHCEACAQPWRSELNMEL